MNTDEIKTLFPNLTDGVRYELFGAARAYVDGDVTAIHRFCRDTLRFRGGDAMRATRRFKTALGLNA